MPVSSRDLRRLLQNYGEVFGRSTELFVCPITLRECEPSELIDGHILNRTLKDAARQTVIQYGSVDKHFGSVAELHFVRWANTAGMSEAGFVRLSKKLRVKLSDGSEVDGYSVKQPSGKWPCLPMKASDESKLLVEIRVAKDDPRLTSQPHLDYTAIYKNDRPYHTGALIKSAHLAIFWLFGYGSVNDACGQFVQCHLNYFFERGNSLAAARSAFSPFQNAISFLLTAEGRPASGIPDTLGSRVLGLHCLENGFAFAVSVYFQINGLPVSVMLPSHCHGHSGGSDIDSLITYRRLMQDRRAVPHNIHSMEQRDGLWYVSESGRPFKSNLPKADSAGER